MRSCLVVLPGPAGAKSDGKNWHRKQEFPASTPGFPDHGRTKAANQWRIEKPQALRRVCFQLMGEATTAFQKPRRTIWSRRRQSTAVNGACQARTTTCCILDEIGGIKDHNSRICLWRMAERCVIRGFALCRAIRGPRGTHRPGQIWEPKNVPQTSVRAPSAAHKAWKWCSFGGAVWELWTSRPPQIRRHRIATLIVQVGQ